MTKISVIMAVHNGERDLPTSIESILNQTFRDFEFLIMDDGSTDQTLNILKRYEKKDSRIKIYTQKNSGLTSSLNTLLRNAQYEYVARMDADDISLSKRFELQVERLNREPSLSVLGGQAVYCDQDMRPIFTPQQLLEHKEIDDNLLRRNCVIAHPTVMMRKSHIDNAGNYDESVSFAEDLDLWLRVAEIGQLANLPNIILNYRISETSISSKNSEKQHQSMKSVCERAWKRRGIEPMPIDTTEWRPRPEKSSRRDFYLQWGWQAWKAGNQPTARRFFCKAVILSPTSVPAWKALFLGGLRPNGVVEERGSEV